MPVSSVKDLDRHLASLSTPKLEHAKRAVHDPTRSSAIESSSKAKAAQATLPQPTMPAALLPDRPFDLHVLGDFGKSDREKTSVALVDDTAATVSRQMRSGVLDKITADHPGSGHGDAVRKDHSATPAMNIEPPDEGQASRSGHAAASPTPQALILTTQLASQVMPPPSIKVDQADAPPTLYNPPPGETVATLDVGPNQVVSVRSSAAEDQSGDLSVRLSLPNLGTIEVRVTKGDQVGPVMTISSDRRETLQVVAIDEAQLRSALHESGLEHRNTSIEYNLIPTSSDTLATMSSSQNGHGRHDGSDERRGAQAASARPGDEIVTFAKPVTWSSARSTLGVIDITA